jgi:hypothetical protein
MTDALVVVGAIRFLGDFSLATTGTGTGLCKLMRLDDAGVSGFRRGAEDDSTDLLMKRFSRMLGGCSAFWLFVEVAFVTVVLVLMLLIDAEPNDIVSDTATL